MGKFTYDLGKLKLTKKDITELEYEFDGQGEYIVCSGEIADNHANFLASYDNEAISYITKSGKTVYLYRWLIFHRIV